MTWTKLSDDFPDECWQLSDKAFRLHVEGLVWSNRKLLNGRLEKAEMQRWAKHPEAADELVASGMWATVLLRDTVADSEHYDIVHAQADQPTREQVLKRRETNRRNGARGGRPQGSQQTNSTPLETDSLTDSLTEKETESLAHVETHRDGTGKAFNSLDTWGEEGPPQSGLRSGSSAGNSNAAPADDEPRCAQHLDPIKYPSPPPCPACGAVRKNGAKRESIQQTAIRTAITGCGDCDSYGRLDDLTDCPKHLNFRNIE